MSHELEIVEQEVAPTLPAAAGGSVAIQVHTAREFPRSITSFIRRATELATLTPEIAASCVYAIPRGGKNIEGPSARLAEIVAHAFGNLRVQAGATDHDERYITARGEAWDVEANVAIAFEVRRRITKANGQAYDDDMITVTGNAAASIALRNAVFKVVPSSFWKPIYAQCRKVIAGDVRTFAARRDELLKAFAVMGVTTEQVCAALAVQGKADVTLDHMVTLTGTYTALKDGETTIEDAFPSVSAGGTRTPQRKSHATKAVQVRDAPPSPEAGPHPDEGERITLVQTAVDPKQGPYWYLETSRGRRATTTDRELGAAVEAHQQAGVPLQMTIQPPKHSANPGKLIELQPLTREPGSDDQ